MQLSGAVLAVMRRRSIEELLASSPRVFLVLVLIVVDSRLGHGGVGDGGEARGDVVDLMAFYSRVRFLSRQWTGYWPSTVDSIRKAVQSNSPTRQKSKVAKSGKFKLKREILQCEFQCAIFGDQLVS